MSTQQELVERALAYPYDVPSGSFLLVDGNPRDARGLGPSDPHTTGRTPLLAYGSNAAPEVLARKLEEDPGQPPVLALRAALSDFDVVYSAHISRYGSVPAALQRSPGTEVSVFVAYLTEAQLELISATEPNYHPVLLTDLSCAFESGDVLTEATAYLTRHGCLLVDDSEVALAEVEARGRRFPAMSQPQVLEHVRAMLAPKQSLEAFVLASAADPDLARSRSIPLPRSGQTEAKRRRAKRASRP
jgi:hypothetical protein